ncbi:hypothetical protein HZA98_03000 [Candidatus Woesearchaeota archaeon]|nr:hypothetical protein [Candidatus Woesearchaeota archaeon]
MSFFKRLVGVFGAFLISLGIGLLFAVVFFSHFAAQEANLDTIFQETFTQMLAEDPQIVRAALEGDSQLAGFFQACDAGSIPADQCVLDAQNPKLSTYLSQASEGWKKQVEPLFRYLDPFTAKEPLLVILGVFFFLLGGFLLFFSLEYDTFIFGRKIIGKLGFHFLLAFLLVYFLLHLGRDNLVSLFSSLMAGAPAVLYSFLSYFLLAFMSALFQSFYYPLLILSILFLSLWIGFWVYSWIKKRKQLS